MNAASETAQNQLLIGRARPGDEVHTCRVFSQGIGINRIGFAVFHQHFGKVMRSFGIDHPEQHAGIMQGDRQIEAVNACGYYTDDKSRPAA